jgi:uncharacterized OB-fold protein
MVEEKKPVETKMEETEEGTVLFNIPFPNGKDLSGLKDMTPIVFRQPYNTVYIHSYAQDSPFFAGLANRRFLVCRDPQTGYTYANPRGHDMYTGQETEWAEISGEGTVHAFTVCHFGSQEFLPECPYVLALIEFEGVDTLFLARLIGVDPNEATIDWIGMKVKPRYRRLSKFTPTDVYFVPADVE